MDLHSVVPLDTLTLAATYGRGGPGEEGGPVESEWQL